MTVEIIHHEDSVAPAVTDDIDSGFGVGSRWYDTTAKDEYVCLDGTAGAAVWKKDTDGASGASPLLFMADMLSLPNSADWAVNALAPLDRDPVNNGFPTRLLGDSSEEGVGLELFLPTSTNIKLTTIARAAVAPGGAVVAKMRVYNRGVPLVPAAVEAWPAATNLTDIDLPITTRFLHYDVSTISYATLGLTAGELTQLEITRNGADGGDTLVGDLALDAIVVEFT